MFTAGILTVSTAVLPLLTGSPIRDCQFGRMGDPVAEAHAVAKFEEAVNDYARVHRRVERAWPPLWLSSDPEQVAALAEQFRGVLRYARPQAAQGNFFTSQVSDIFRSRIVTALRENDLDLAAIALPTDEEGGSNDWWKPVVNGELAFTATAAVWPIFERLPVLPPELEYRLVGRDLVLLDLHANMVVDVLDLALPAFVAPNSDIRIDVTGDEGARDRDEHSVAPLGDEFIGCWYGDAREATAPSHEEPREY